MVAIKLGPNSNKIEINPIKVNNNDILQHEHAIVHFIEYSFLIKINNLQTNKQLLFTLQ